MLTFRGQSYQDGEDPQNPYCRYWFDIVKGVPLHESPEARGKDIIAPGREGRYAGNRVLDIHTILIEGWIRGVGDDQATRAADWHQTTMDLLASMELDEATGDLIVGPGGGTVPYLGLEADYLIRARPVDQMSGDILNRMSFQRWSFKLQSIWGDEHWWTEVGSS